MDPQLFALIALILGLVGGVALGWFGGSRPATELRARLAENEGEAKALDERFRKAAAELGNASIELATLKAQAANFDEQKAGLMQAQASLKAEFEAAGAKILGQAQDVLLERAKQRFTESEEKNEARIKALLEPVGQRLASYEAQVGKLEKERVDAFGQLGGLIQSLREGQEQVRAEAARLGSSLRNAPKARGRWGEQQLRNVLEQCGLAEHTDFVTEHSIDTEEGRLRPDAIVNIPGQKQLVIDAKVSLNAYQDAFEATDEESRKRSLDAHAASMRNHVQQLGAKGYQSQFADAPDYVVMFVPGEHFVAAALEQDSDLWDFAFRNKVLLATPTNLVAIARTVAMVWKQDQLAKEAVEIGKAGGELYERLAKVTEDLTKMGTHLGRAVGSYNDFARSFDSRVLVSAKRLRDKGIEIGKREIEDVPLIEAAPRHAEGGALALDEPATDEATE